MASDHMTAYSLSSNTPKIPQRIPHRPIPKTLKTETPPKYNENNVVKQAPISSNSQSKSPKLQHKTPNSNPYANPSNLESPHATITHTHACKSPSSNPLPQKKAPLTQRPQSHSSSSPPPPTFPCQPHQPPLRGPSRPFPCSPHSPDS